jgi:serine/threonine protein kinase
MSSPNHDDLAHLKIPLEDILSATDNFSDEKLVREDASGKVYSGESKLSKLGSEYLPPVQRAAYMMMLMLSLQNKEWHRIFVRRLNKEWFDGDQQFWMEVSMLSSLKHKNLVSLVGFCDDNDEKVIIYKPETGNGSLSNYLGNSMFLTWVQRLKICVGIAQALSYIHYDESRDFSVIHRNIDSNSILLDYDLEPKLGDFKRSMKIKASERHNSFYTDKVCSTDGYTDPKYIETKSVNQKSDIYSFGIVMFELLCGRKTVINNGDNKYLAPVAIFHYREKTLDEIIDPDLLKQMDPRSLNTFTETAYECLSEEQSQRPNMDQVVTRLEKALELQLECKNAVR